MNQDLETRLRAYLDPANPAGRPLADFDLRVEQFEGAIAIHLHPKGFNAELAVFVVKGNTLLADLDAYEHIVAIRAKREAEQKAIDDAHAAEQKRQDELRLEAEAEAKAKAQGEAKRFESLDPAQGMPSP